MGPFYIYDSAASSPSHLRPSVLPHGQEPVPDLVGELEREVKTELHAWRAVRIYAQRRSEDVGSDDAGETALLLWRKVGERLDKRAKHQQA